MNKKISLGVAVAFSAVVAAIVFSLTMIFSQNIFNQIISNDTQRDDIYSKIEKIDTVVKNNFLFAVDEQKIVDMVGTGYVSGLDDRYAVYLTKEEYEEKLLNDSGELVGIGVTVQQDSAGYLQVMGLNENGPAFSSGIQVGDLIVKVFDEDVVTLGIDEALKKISGEEGTKVKVTVRRGTEDIEYEMARKKLEISSVEYRMIGKNAYIKIDDFNTSTVEQFSQALKFAEANEALSLVFDLRNNTGGTMDSVCEMLDMLVPKGTITSITDSKGKTEIYAESDPNEVDLPMICLTNGSTASAAELFVSVLKDYEKADSVGTNTYGKGVMQTTFPLSDGSAVKITTDYFNPPVSANFNGTGIAPDYEVTLTKEQEEVFDTLDETNDPQLIKAIEVISSKFVTTTPDDEDTSSDDTSSEATSSDDTSSEDTSSDDTSSEDTSSESTSSESTSSEDSE